MSVSPCCSAIFAALSSALRKSVDGDAERGRVGGGLLRDAVAEFAACEESRGDVRWLDESVSFARRELYGSVERLRCGLSEVVCSHVLSVSGVLLCVWSCGALAAKFFCARR